MRKAAAIAMAVASLAMAAPADAHTLGKDQARTVATYTLRLWAQDHEASYEYIHDRYLSRGHRKSRHRIVYWGQVDYWLYPGSKMHDGSLTEWVVFGISVRFVSRRSRRVRARIYDVLWWPRI